MCKQCKMLLETQTQGGCQEKSELDNGQENVFTITTLYTDSDDNMESDEEDLTRF